MFCPQCGNENEAEAAFCCNCGTKLEGIDVTKDANVESSTQSVVDENATRPSSTENEAHETVTNSTQMNQSEKQAGPMKVVDAGASVAAFLRARKRIAIFAAAILAALIAVFAWFGLSGVGTLGQTSETFRSAFESSDTVRKGIASNDLVNETPYSVTSFECTDIKKASDYEVTARVKAVIENESFKTEVTALATYIDGTKLPSGYTWASSFVDGYNFDVTGSTTTPKKGIDKDSANIAQAFQSVLSDDGMTCTVTVAETERTWFVDVDYTTVHTYRFNENRWFHADAETSASYDYHDIEGTYTTKGNSEITFTIRDLDKEKGSFVVDYTASKDGLFGYNVSGTLNADIIPKISRDYASGATKSTYEYEAKGTSSGGNGQASANGEFEVTESGENAISASISVDYTSEYGRNVSGSNWGRLFKQ